MDSTTYGAMLRAANDIVTQSSEVQVEPIYFLIKIKDGLSMTEFSQLNDEACNWANGAFDDILAID